MPTTRLHTLLAATLAACALLVPTTAAQAATAQAAACPDADAQPTGDNLPQLRAATLCLLNAERTPRGLTALSENELLTEASQAYSQQMVDEQFFSHVTPEGVNLTQRLKGVGYLNTEYFVIGENIAWGTGGLDTPARTMQDWMESPGHRANILEPRFREVGMGIAPGAPNSRTAPAAATYTTDFGVINGTGAAAPPVTGTAKPRHRTHRSCAALRRAKARGRLSRTDKKRLTRCKRRVSRRR